MKMTEKMCSILNCNLMLNFLLFVIPIFSTNFFVSTFKLYSKYQRKCEEIYLPVCKEIRINNNNVNTSSSSSSTVSKVLNNNSHQMDQEIYQCWNLMKVNCSDDLKFFLCSMYTPVCEEDHQSILPIYRSVCERVKSDCEVDIFKFGFPWSEFMDCNIFPSYGLMDKLCLENNSDNTKEVSTLATIPSPLLTSSVTSLSPFLPSSSSIKSTSSTHENRNQLQVLAGHRITLVCNITFPVNDHILLILWYKGDINGSPIYTIDGRYKNQIEEAEHFKSSDLGERAYVDIKSLPVTLTIDPVLVSDDGFYFCRVDFKWARTSATSIRLNVLVPPSKLTITNVNGIPFRKFAGPFNQGETALIKCFSFGGKPSPSLIWYQDDKIIDDSFNSTDSSSSSPLTIVENTLIINNLQRNHLFQDITCKSHHEAYGSSMSSVSLEVNLKPLSVKITSLQLTHVVGLKSKFTCTTHGSRPPPIISWYLNNRTLAYSRESYSEDGNYSSSTLELTNSRSMDGSILICRAVNKRIPGSSLQDELKLDIKFSPICKDNQRVNYPASIGELIDITCEIISNPNEVTFTWTKNYNETVDSTLKQSTTKYQSTVSTIVQSLAPILTTTTTTKIPTGTETIISTISSSNQIKSVLKVNVESTSDFAVYSCKAENTIGITLEPCLYTIEPQDPPSRPKYCSIMEHGVYLSIDCITDESSPPVDYYILEAYEYDNNNHHNHLNHDGDDEVGLFGSDGQEPVDKANETNLPVFKLSKLEPNASYILVTYAVNRIGKSSDLIIPLRKAKSTSSHLHVPRVKEVQLKDSDPISPMFGTISLIIIFTCSIILSILCLLIILIRWKLNGKHEARVKNKQNDSRINVENDQSDNHINDDQNDNNNCQGGDGIVDDINHVVHSEDPVNVAMIVDYQLNCCDLENKLSACESNRNPDVIPFKEPDLDDIKESFKSGAIVIPEAFLTQAYIQFNGEIIETINCSPSRKLEIIGENISITNCAQESYRSTPV